MPEEKNKKIHIVVEKTIELKNQNITAEEINELAEYIKQREKSLFVSNAELNINRINKINIYFENEMGKVTQLPNEFLFIEKKEKGVVFDFYKEREKYLKEEKGKTV